MAWLGSWESYNEFKRLESLISENDVKSKKSITRTENGELIENQETVTNAYSSTPTPTPTPTPGAPEEKPGGKYGLTVTQTITGKEVSTTASFASQEQYD